MPAKPALDVYMNGDNDQPTTCPKCGARTDFDKRPGSVHVQRHGCLGCKYVFFLEFDA
jgi:transposase-like protein